MSRPESPPPNPESQRALRPLFRRWVLATSVGWLIGFVLMLFGAILADVLGAEGIQSYIGIGMGAGMGYAQARVARPALGATNWWGWACLIGLATPFVLMDFARLLGYPLPFKAALMAGATGGGLLTGLLQQRSLPNPAHNANWWMLASGLGWTAVAATVPLYGTVPGVAEPWLPVLNMAAMVLGGVIIGLVTGPALVWLQPRQQQEAV